MVARIVTELARALRWCLAQEAWGWATARRLRTYWWLG